MKQLNSLGVTTNPEDVTLRWNMDIINIYK